MPTKDCIGALSNNMYFSGVVCKQSQALMSSSPQETKQPGIPIAHIWDLTCKNQPYVGKTFFKVNNGFQQYNIFATSVASYSRPDIC